MSADGASGLPVIGPGIGPVIGLVNNMPDAGLLRAERQFAALLAAASGGKAVLRLFALRSVPRGAAAQADLAARYRPIEALYARAADEDIDGLIVTGAEPLAPTLAAEPYWEALAELVDYAEATALPVLWSCLAAHAAVRRLDGIERTALPEKLSGVFDFTTAAADHPLLAGAAAWLVPHSRWNGLCEAALVARGYRVLSRSPAVGVDCFARGSFVFVQGHPEYDAAALLREYRRDVGRFLAGAGTAYPALPQIYFDGDNTTALLAFRTRALRHRARVTLADFPAIDPALLENPWREAAVQLCRNWLGQLRPGRDRQAEPVRARAGART